MKKKMDGKIIGLYFREQRRLLGLAIIWVGVFFLLFALMRIPFTYIWYPTLICTVLFCGFLFFDMLRFAGKHRELQQMKNHIDITLDNLPEPENTLEQDYQELLSELMLHKNRGMSALKATKNEMTEYVTIWTHQIKTPLTALQLMAAELEEPAKAETMTRLFEIEQYTDMMLQYLRLESDSTDYVLKEYSVKSMVNQAVKYYARVFIAKGITVRIDIPEDEKVVTDEKWMVFALKQLISNALKYTKQGSIHIYMDDCLVIEDTGIGIAAEDLPRIMERGYTGYNGRKDKKATGLGLFLVNQILKQLHHGIEITSEAGVGTKVALRFNDGEAGDSLQICKVREGNVRQS